MCESRQDIFHNNVLYKGDRAFAERHVLCTRFANVSQRDRFVFISMGLKIIFHWFGLMSWRIRYEYSQSWNAALCNNRPTTCGEKQQQLSRSEQRKGTPLRKHTNKDHFRCLITIWSIARRGLNELIFVKTSNSTKTDIFLIYFACSSKLVRATSDTFSQHGSHIFWQFLHVKLNFILTGCREELAAAVYVIWR